MRKSLGERYYAQKANFLIDESINKVNRDLFEEFFVYEERKLKRKNGIPELDDGCFRTLSKYISRFRNMNAWFKNKPLKDLTKEDIRQVYDDLEDGVIKTQLGTPVGDRHSYYSKIFKSKLFKMVGKDDLAREVIEYTTERNEEVRFISEDQFHKLVENAYNPHQKVLMWLAWDIGENINTLLRLKKSDFTKQINPVTKDPEYRINLRREILKRTRKARSELTIYSETVKLLDEYLTSFNEDDIIFHYGYRNAWEFFKRIATLTGVKTAPTSAKVTWKDLRSSMACTLLQKGWTTDEVNARLGHKPSSTEIDKYVNFLAIDRNAPKKKVQEFAVLRLEEELENIKQQSKMSASKHETDMKLMEQKYQEQIKSMVERVEAHLAEKIMEKTARN